jgi:hypothetical protein
MHLLWQAFRIWGTLWLLATLTGDLCKNSTQWAFNGGEGRLQLL